MMKNSICIWSPKIKGVTFITVLVIIVVFAYSLYVYLHTNETITRNVIFCCMIVLGLVVGVAVLQTPRSVEVSAEQVRIKLLLPSVCIRRDEITKIEHYPSGMASMRIVGMGHFFGNVGLFHSDVCGRYYSLVTNEQDIVLIYRRTKKPIAVSVADPTIFSLIAPIEKR